MSGARDLIDQIRAELKPLEGRIIGHRYLAAIENGRVSREALALFAVQQNHIIASDLRSIAQSLARHGTCRAERICSMCYREKIAPLNSWANLHRRSE